LKKILVIILFTSLSIFLYIKLKISNSSSVELNEVKEKISNLKFNSKLKKSKHSIIDNSKYPKQIINLVNILHAKNSCPDCFEKSLAEYNEDINFRLKTGDTLLSLAVGGRDLSAVKLLLDKKADPNIKFNNYNYTMLMDASFQGDLPILSLLLKYGADIDQVDKEGSTALIYASREGNLNIVKSLLVNNANIEISDNLGKKAIDYAKKYKHLEVIKLLIETK